MKKVLYLIPAFLLVLAAQGMSQAKLTVKWKFHGIIEGYDHTCRTEVFIDGKSVGVSSESLESVPNEITVNVPTGSHQVKVVNYALYEGEWEEHTVANNYSLDCIFDQEVNLTSKTKPLCLLFDIENEQTTYKWGKMPKAPKKKK